MAVRPCIHVPGALLGIHKAILIMLIEDVTRYIAEGIGLAGLYHVKRVQVKHLIRN